MGKNTKYRKAIEATTCKRNNKTNNRQNPMKQDSKKRKVIVSRPAIFDATKVKDEQPQQPDKQNDGIEIEVNGVKIKAKRKDIPSILANLNLTCKTINSKTKVNFRRMEKSTNQLSWLRQSLAIIQRTTNANSMETRNALELAMTDELLQMSTRLTKHDDLPIEALQILIEHLETGAHTLELFASVMNAKFDPSVSDFQTFANEVHDKLLLVFKNKQTIEINKITELMAVTSLTGQFSDALVHYDVKLDPATNIKNVGSMLAFKSLEAADDNASEGKEDQSYNSEDQINNSSDNESIDNTSKSSDITSNSSVSSFDNSESCSELLYDFDQESINQLTDENDDVDSIHSYQKSSRESSLNSDHDFGNLTEEE